MTYPRIQVQRIEGVQVQRFLLLVTSAMIAQIFYLASAWLLPLVSEFRLIRDTISELVLGRYGWVQSLAFLFCGLSTVGLAYALRPFLPRGGQSGSGLLLLALHEIGLILAAIFPTERIDNVADGWTQAIVGTLHLIVSIMSYLCVMLGIFILTWVFTNDNRWQARTTWSALFFVGVLVLLFGQTEGPWVGLMQRLLVSMIAGWSLMVAARLCSVVQAN
jgi:hypothetical protein